MQWWELMALLEVPGGAGHLRRGRPQLSWARPPDVQARNTDVGLFAQVRHVNSYSGFACLPDVRRYRDISLPRARSLRHMTIVPVSPGSQGFSQVLALWGKERATLGLMPEGGFDDAARAGELLLALDPQGACAGYVMFRRTRQRTATIVHICVDPVHRCTGVARRLFDAVKSRCSDCFEIRVTCRRDFEVNSLWHKLGFVALGEKPGRARDSVLTLWRYELAQLPLLRAIESERSAFPGAKSELLSTRTSLL